MRWLDFVLSTQISFRSPCLLFRVSSSDRKSDFFFFSLGQSLRTGFLDFQPWGSGLLYLCVGWAGRR